jgi:hypothetical protein
VLVDILFFPPGSLPGFFVGCDFARPAPRAYSKLRSMLAICSASRST